MKTRMMAACNLPRIGKIREKEVDPGFCYHKSFPLPYFLVAIYSVQAVRSSEKYLLHNFRLQLNRSKHPGPPRTAFKTLVVTSKSPIKYQICLDLRERDYLSETHAHVISCLYYSFSWKPSAHPF